MTDIDNIIRLAELQEPAQLPPPSVPMAVARIFLTQCYSREDTLTLRHWRGVWWAWKTSHWSELEGDALRSMLYLFTEHAVYLTNDGPEPWKPTQRKIRDLSEALAAICILPSDVDQPCWLDQRMTGIIVAVANGLLDVERRQLLPHTPWFFNQTSVPFAYEPEAPRPQRWHGFLDSVWSNEPASIAVLGEWFGYVISGRTDLHKIFMTIGPTRSGKGVIARVETALVGNANMAGPTLNSLGGEFGLQPLIGKSLAIISDARLQGENSSITVERLLSISGEDTLSINRKYKSYWTGKLSVRIHLLSNELPRLGDASTAIVGRIILLQTSLSWLGREDHELEPDLHTELPGILNFALDGLQRLINNGNRFTPVPSSEEAITLMRDLASPVAAFVRERCQIGPEHEVEVDPFYTVYRAWCDDNGHSKSTKATFGRDLRAAVPSVRKKRPLNENDERIYKYDGIKLISSSPTQAARERR